MIFYMTNHFLYSKKMGKFVIQFLKMMNWKQLLSGKRLGVQSGADSSRTVYERDYDRVVFSSAFRRMQDKTQVIPLPDSDFVHTRLTHSLEVSCVGRSLGRMIGQQVLEKHSDLRETAVTDADFGAIVAAACLAHDIGNPPFGHSGEKAISEYFLNGKGKRFQKDVAEHEWKDLTSFEGNANGFRLLTDASNGLEGGLGLCYATLGAFTKYPKTAAAVKQKAVDGGKRASQKKYGIFNYQKNVLEEVAKDLGLLSLGGDSWARHPLAFVMEAADDICYRIIDFEDGIRLGLIGVEEGFGLLKNLIPEEQLDEDKLAQIFDDRARASYLRAKAIGAMIAETVEVFMTNEEAILDGSFDVALTDVIPSAKNLDEIQKLSIIKVYQSRPVLDIESAGFTVLGDLLEMFIKAVNDSYAAKENPSHKFYRSEKLMQILPKQFLGVTGETDDSLYMRLMRISQFVAGMTDSYAINLYHQLKGIKLS